MTAPFYDDGTVTLYLGDCREVDVWLTADVLVTDPPYGRNWKQGWTTKSGGTDGHPGIAGDRDPAMRDAVLAMWVDRPGVVFGDPLVDRPVKTRQVLGFRKPPGAGSKGTFGGFRRDLELIYLIGPWNAGLGGISSILASNGRALVQGRYGHPHAKPVDVMETLITACPPGVIADPFAGSGSTLVAARNLGRKAIGVELDERYAERAAQRLSQGCLEIA